MSRSVTAVRDSLLAEQHPHEDVDHVPVEQPHHSHEDELALPLLVGEPAHHHRQHRLGLILLGFVVVLWLASGVLTQKIFLAMNYDKPLYLTYFNSSLFALYLIHPIVRRALCLKHRRFSANKLSESETNKLALQFLFLWFFMNLSYNWSLSRTSVASNTILSTSSPIFTLCFSRMLLSHRINRVNSIGVMFTLAGTTLVSLQDWRSGRSDTIAGDAAALASAVLYGIYSPMLRRTAGGDEHIDTIAFFGYMGLYSLVLLFPVLLLFHFTALSPLQIPNRNACIGLLVNGLISIVSDLLWARSVLLTSPLVATVGLSMMTPAALMADWVFNDNIYTPTYFLGSAIVTIGFVLANWDHSRRPSTAAVEEEA